MSKVFATSKHEAQSKMEAIVRDLAQSETVRRLAAEEHIRLLNSSEGDFDPASWFWDNPSN